MCTVTWFRQARAYHLFFNRDEQRTRAVAAPPRIYSGPGPAFIAPMDGEAGGAWLATNDQGLTVCLLNYTAEAEPVRPRPERSAPSRGLLVLDAVRAASARDLGRTLVRQRLTSYPPFLLIGVELSQPAVLFRWDGSRLRAFRSRGGRAAVSTSSVHPRQVVASRLIRFEQFSAAHPQDDPSHFRRFHAEHEPEPGPFSVCMHREDAQTVSFSHVAVQPDATVYRYLNGAPCRAASTAELTVCLPRS